MSSELTFRPAHELAALLRKKEVSPVELVDAFLDRIDAMNPRLNAFITVAALGAGLVAEMTAGGMSVTQYHVAIMKPLQLRDVVPSILKTVAFGFLIGVTGCGAGLKAEGGTEGVGRAATRGVVMSIFLVLVADVFLVMLTQLLP